MSKDNTNTGGPAFACEGVVTRNGILYEGMTLRDYFAAKAMQGFCGSKVGEHWSNKRLSCEAYELADAMLEAREQ
jgi:hypothetical protein